MVLNLASKMSQRRLCTLLFAVILYISLIACNAEPSMSATEVQYCCSFVAEWDDCYSACLQFASSCPPDVENKTNYLTSFCPEIPNNLDTCLSNTNQSNAQTNPTPSPELIACCSESSKQSCTDVCIEQLFSGDLESSETIEAVISECGPPLVIDGDPIWNCFFQFAANQQSTSAPSTEQNNKNVKNSTNNCTAVLPTTSTETTTAPLNINYADWARLQCCLKANSTECSTACQREYSGNRVTNTWETLTIDCKFRATEDELFTCINDVEDRCQAGCSGLEFCTNFNNRPLTLFRQCNEEADNEAKTNYEDWKKYRRIPHLLLTVRLKDIETCLPDMWKAAACAASIQTCDTETHSSLMCKDECLTIMRECSINDDYTPEEICEILSPSNLQERCTPLTEFTSPSNYTTDDVSSLTSPCQSNPCTSGLKCIVNEACYDTDHSCVPYSCIEDCDLGKSPPLSVSKVSNVHVTTLPKAGAHCFGFVNRSTSGDCGYGMQNADLYSEYCENIDQCSYNGRNYTHGEVFNLSDHCNFCVCQYGKVICTRQVCLTSQEGETPLQSCDCPTVYHPVCVKDKRTIPNACFADCLGYHENQRELGSCNEEDPCDSSPCPSGKKCVPYQHVCLSEDGNAVSNCPQYTCETVLTCEGSLIGPVCDKNNNQHNTLCEILFTKEEIDYKGYCQLDCFASRRSSVCGVNGETYASRCHADEVGVAVDYIGDCKDVPAGPVGCEHIKCPGMPYFNQDEICGGPTPPGACCQQCGGMLRAIVDKNGLQRSRKAMGSNSVDSYMIIKRMRHHMDILECQLFSYVTLDGTITFLILPVNSSSYFNVQACNLETSRLSTLINNRSPILASDPFLFFLIAAEPSSAHKVPITTIIYSDSFEPSGCDRRVVSYTILLIFSVVTVILWTIN